jgi:hypothetical protein
VLLRGDDQIPAKRHSLAPVETYEVERQQFDHIESLAGSIGLPLNAAFALIPVAIALSVTLATAAISNARTVGILWNVMTAFYLVGILCALFAMKQRGELKRYMQVIRNSQVAPVAAKGASTPSDLTAVSDPEAPPRVNTSEPQAEEVNDAQ